MGILVATGYVPPGDKYAGLPTISILVSSDLVCHTSPSSSHMPLVLTLQQIHACVGTYQPPSMLSALSWVTGMIAIAKPSRMLAV